MKRYMNKRGDEGFKLVQLLIALLVLVAVGVGIFFVSDEARGAGSNIPGDVEIVTQSCGAVASPELTESYCGQIREIGKDKYVTCDYAARVERFQIDQANVMIEHCATYKKNGVQEMRIASEIQERKLKPGATVNGVPVAGYYAPTGNVLVDAVGAAQAKLAIAETTGVQADIDAATTELEAAQAALTE